MPFNLGRIELYFTGWTRSTDAIVDGRHWAWLAVDLVDSGCRGRNPPALVQ